VPGLPGPAGGVARDASLVAGVFLLCLAGLAFQVALTRLCSAALNYHLTFLALSAGVLGTGAGGTWVALWRRSGRDVEEAPGGATRPWPARHRLSLLVIGAAGMMALLGGAFAWVPLTTLPAPWLVALLLLGYPALAGPFFFAGAAVALALRTWPRAAGRIYAADLAGAGVGCLLAVPAMDLLAPPLTAAACAVLALAGARLLAPYGRWYPVAGAIGLLAVLAGVLQPSVPNVLPSKPLAVLLDTTRFPGASRELTAWDATSRVDVFHVPGHQLLWQVGRGDDPSGLQPLEMKGITIDADALSAVLRREPGQSLPVLRRLPASVVYELAPRRRVLVIGPGGGVDVAAALAYGAERVEAVEVNRAVVRLLLGPLAAYSGGLFADPAVRLVHDEGRGYLQRSGERYDAIVLTAVDNWAALASGAYSLSESYIYTAEAMGAYYEHLTPGGMLAISRWYTAPPRELQRLAQMSVELLQAQGESPQRSVLLVRAGDFGTLLVRRGTMSESEVARAQAFAASRGFDLQSAAAGEWWTGPGHRSPTDDRPFFFDFLPWSAVLRGQADPLPRGHAVLLLALIQGTCLGVAGVVLPMRRLRHGPAPAGLLVPGLYAASIGLGFMLVELTLFQRLILLLGLPALSLAVAMAGLLLGAGAGSALWGRSRPREARLVLGGAAVVLTLHATLLPALWPVAMTWPLAGRLILALVSVFIPGLAMGPALPAMVALVSPESRVPSPESTARSRPGAGLVPWLWGINGAASAVGAALAVMLAMELGARQVLLLAAGCYALAAVLLARWPTRVPR
jgi:hypothetical protein